MSQAEMPISASHALCNESLYSLTITVTMGGSLTYLLTFHTEYTYRSEGGVDVPLWGYDL